MRGVSRSSRFVVRAAMDALAQDDRAGCVRSSRVVLIPRCWDQVLSMMFDKATEANKPVLRGERGAAVKPLRRECRTCSALPDYLVCVSSLCTQACGCGQRPAFPAPSIFEGRDAAKLGHFVPRECERSSLRGANGSGPVGPAR